LEKSRKRSTGWIDTRNGKRTTRDRISHSQFKDKTGLCYKIISKNSRVWKLTPEDPDINKTAYLDTTHPNWPRFHDIMTAIAIYFLFSNFPPLFNAERTIKDLKDVRPGG